MKHPVSVLGVVNKDSNSATPPAAVACAAHLRRITGEYHVLNKALARTREQLTDLFAGCSPQADSAIRQYLDSPAEADRWLLDGWEKCGRNDRGRTVRVELTDIGKKTVTPLGVACLVRYCRGWLDEAEARVAAMRAEVEALASDPQPTNQAERGPGRPPTQQSCPKVPAGHQSHSKPSQSQRRRQQA